jgi:hypothetical protein
MVRPTALFGTPTLAKLLPWAPSLLSVAVMVETVSLRPPKELVPVVPVVVAVCTQNLELMQPPDREMLVVEQTLATGLHPVAVVVPEEPEEMQAAVLVVTVVPVWHQVLVEHL